MEDPQVSQDSTQADADGASFNLLKALRILRSAGSALFAQAALHGQLARVEWAEEKSRLLRMAAIALLGFACLLCVMLFAGVLVLAISWESVYRIPALMAVIAVYALGVGVAWHQLQALAALGEQAFAATREEIAADLAMLKSRL
jgi:uncharacterized membrane protein YqjE